MKKPAGNQDIFARGRLFELVHEVQPDGRVFEVARRAPGVRVIIADRDNRKLLLTREFRKELSEWDYRLPGGKVFDSLEDYEAHRASGEDIIGIAEAKAIGESLEEAGIEVDSAELFKKSTLGATVEWDLYIFEAGNWRLAKSQRLEAGERIVTDNWFSYDEVRQMILNGQMQEERIALILLQWLDKGEKA